MEMLFLFKVYGFPGNLGWTPDTEDKKNLKNTQVQEKRLSKPKTSQHPYPAPSYDADKRKKAVAWAW